MGFSGQYVRLSNVWYGLRQAPKLWYEVLEQALRKFGMHKSQHSDCLFVKPRQSLVYILVCVDDLLVIGPQNAVAKAKEQLSSEF